MSLYTDFLILDEIILIIFPFMQHVLSVIIILKNLPYHTFLLTHIMVLVKPAMDSVHQQHSLNQISLVLILPFQKAHFSLGRTIHITHFFLNLSVNQSESTWQLHGKNSMKKIKRKSSMEFLVTLRFHM